MPRRDPALGALALSGPLLIVVVALLGWLTPGYHPWSDTVSRLGSPGEPLAMWARLAFVAYGLSVMAGARPLTNRLGAPPVMATLVAIYGAAGVTAGLASKGLPGASHTLPSRIHVTATLVGGACILAVLAIVASRSPARLVGSSALASGLATIAAVIAFKFSWGASDYGAIERVALGVPMCWLSATAFLVTRTQRTRRSYQPWQSVKSDKFGLGAGGLLRGG